MLTTKRLPEDAWHLIAECSGLSTVPTIPLICKDAKNAQLNDELWKKHCSAHFPSVVFSSPHEEEKINWLERFKELETTNYPADKREKLLFRTVKEGVLSTIQEIKPTLDEINLTEISNKGYTPIEWANKLGYQSVLDFFYNIARHTLAPNKTDSRGYDYISYLIMCNQADKFQKLLEVNDSLILDRGLNLFQLCLNSGSKNIFPILIRYFPDLLHEVSIGNTALHIASFKGHTEIAAQLLACGVAVNNAQNQHNNITPLLLAAQNGHYDICKLLIAKEADVDQIMLEGFSPLFAACQNGHYEIAELLLQKGANAKLAVFDCGSFPLGKAAWKGYSDIVELLIFMKADLNQTRADGLTALFIAAQQRHIKTAERLLEAGADVNKVSKQGASPLLAASEEGYLDIVKLLVKYRANLTQARSDGFTAFILAAQNGHLDIVEYLFSHGVNVNQLTKSGASSLLAAAQNGHIAVVKFLLAQGADPTLCMHNGTSPLHIAALNKHENIVILLRKALKKPEVESKSNDSLCILISAKHAIHSVLPEFKKLNMARAAPIFFDKNGNEVAPANEDKVAHIFLKNCNCSEFLELLQENSLQYRFVQHSEVSKVKLLLDSFKFKIDLESILKRDVINLKVNVKSSTPEMKM